jgi:hypothetical protein
LASKIRGSAKEIRQHPHNIKENVKSFGKHKASKPSIPPEGSKPNTTKVFSTKDDTSCLSCGRDGHAAGNCILVEKNHPDRNQDMSVSSFSVSEKGKQWLEKGHKHVPFGLLLNDQSSKIDNRKKAKPEYKNKKGIQYEHEPESLMTVEEHDPTLCDRKQISLEDCSIISRVKPRVCDGKTMLGMSVSVLLDTGCYPANGYISYRVATYLKKHNAISRQVHRQVRACFHGQENIYSILEEVDVVLYIYNSITKEKFSITVPCGVVSEMTKDVVLGYNMLKHSKEIRQILFLNLLSDEELDRIQQKIAQYIDNLGLSCMEKTQFVNDQITDIILDKEYCNAVRESVINQEIVLPTVIEGDTPEFIAKQRALCIEHAHVFDRSLREEAALVPPMELEVDDRWEARENRQPPRPQGPVKNQEIAKQTQAMLDANVIRVSTASAHSQVLLVPKSDGSWRFCVDYRRLNVCTKPVAWPIPNIPQMLQRLC